MASGADRSQLAVAVVAAAATAVLVFFGTGLHPWWPLLWVAPIPVLAVAPRLSARAAFAAAVAAWLLGGLNMWRYLHTVTRAPAIVTLVILAIPALAVGAAVLLYRRLLLRGNGVAAALAFPAAWVSYEHVLSVVSPHGTFGSLAYNEIDFLPIVQVASVAGVAGISFCVLFFASTVAALLHGPRRTLLAAIAVTFFAAVFAFGVLRLTNAASAPRVKVGLIASDLAENVDPQSEGAETARLLDAYRQHAAELTRRGAQVIVVPEKLGVVLEAGKRSTDAPLTAFAASQRADVVVGVIRVAPPLQFNEARMYSAIGVLTYEKQHMLPPFESRFEPGRSPLVIRKPSGIWGVAICKDLDFPTLGRQYAQRGTGLLLVPAWDFVDDGWLHGRMAVMRGVEGGFTIARAAKQGLLTVSDDRGRILAEQRSAAAPFATLLADAPVRHDVTPYSRFGDWFAWLTVAGLVMLISRSLWPG